MPNLAQCSVFTQLLQITGCAAIVAFHVDAPAARGGWIAVELFFVVAGMNMASSLQRRPPVSSYLMKRVRRLAPEVLVVWGLTLLATLAGVGTAGMAVFLFAAPLFVENLVKGLPFENADALFAPLWFVGALVQLQVCLYASRGLWETLRPRRFVTAAFLLGLALRLLFVGLFSRHWRNLADSTGEALYSMPFCHIEAIVLGVVLGRGGLPRLGRQLPWCLLAVVVAGVANVLNSSGQITCASLDPLGYYYTLCRNAGYLWGYPLLALTAAALCARDNPLAAAVNRLRLAPAWEGCLARFASITYGIYCFHGLIIATGLNGAARLTAWSAPRAHLALFLITFSEAALIASGFGWLTSLLRTKLALAPSPDSA